MEVQPKMHPFFDKKAPPPPPPRSPSLVDHLPPGPGSSPLTSTSLSPPPSTTTSTPTILAPPPPAPAINAQAGPSSVPARSSRETSTSTSLLLPSSRSRRSVSSVSSSSSRRLLPPLPTAATPLPTFKLFDGEKPVQDKKENEKEEEEELTNAMKLLAFEFALPPSTFLSIHQAVQHAPNHEQGAQIAAMVLGNQEDGVKFALAVRTGELKGFMRGVTPQAYDTWRESRTFELSDQEGKERMKKGKKALQPAVQQEVINMLVAILPAPPSSPSSSSSEDLSELSGSDSAPPPKKKQKYEGSDGTSVLVKQSGSKGEIIVIKKPHMDKITITSTNVMSFNRRDRERYGDLVFVSTRPSLSFSLFLPQAHTLSLRPFPPSPPSPAETKPWNTASPPPPPSLPSSTKPTSQSSLSSLESSTPHPSPPRSPSLPSTRSSLRRRSPSRTSRPSTPFRWTTSRRCGTSREGSGTSSASLPSELEWVSGNPPSSRPRSRRGRGRAGVVREPKLLLSKKTTGGAGAGARAVRQGV
ncbi:hypothetical protein BDY24DRAFT_392788 [Mrakia frigida]|uniref:uncharacterized protein n=1 Tax=Mrakia frigida TaxID=29902 RepID=UPI003FCC13C5